MQASITTTQSISGKTAGWASIAIFLLWILAVVSSIAQNVALPSLADAFIPARIQANILLISFGWFVQVVMGTAIVALALPLSYYLATPLTMTMRFALAAGVVAGAFMVAAGAGGQENVFVAVFYTPEMAGPLAKAIGTPDLTVINAANNLVAGGMRSTSAYALGWAVVLWSIAALKSGRFSRLLNWIGIISGVLFALTVWIGPFTGFPAFLGFLIWHLWLGITLIRAK